MAGAIRSDPYRGASKLAGRSKCVNQEASKVSSRVKRIAGILGVPRRYADDEGQCRHRCSGTYRCRTPRGRRGRHVRKEYAAKARYAAPGIASFMPTAEYAEW